IEASHEAQKYGEAWKVVNEISGRKRAKEGQVEGSSPEERVTTWFTHFKKLLGNPPEVEDLDEEIPNIFEDLDINDGLWALSKAQEKLLDGTYTRMLLKALNILWSSQIPNQQLHGDLPAVSKKIASRRLQLAGHCYRHPELITQKLVLWEPTHGHRGRGRPITTYIDTLKRDTGAFEASEIAVLMADKRLWKDLVVARLRATK
ncbi:unnamed protein product, partial [Porites lobata]